jgi:hypothetical protein
MARQRFGTSLHRGTRVIVNRHDLERVRPGVPGGAPNDAYSGQSWSLTRAILAAEAITVESVKLMWLDAGSELIGVPGAAIEAMIREVTGRVLTATLTSESADD